MEFGKNKTDFIGPYSHGLHFVVKSVSDSTYSGLSLGSDSKQAGLDCDKHWNRRKYLFSVKDLQQMLQSQVVKELADTQLYS